MTSRFPDDSIRVRRSDGALGSLRPNTNYGIGSVHNFKKEIEDTLRPAMEGQTRGDMHDEPSHEAVDKEIAYRWGQEALAERQRVGSRLQERLEAQRIPGFQARLWMVQQCDVAEVEIDGRTFWVRPVGSWVLESGNVVAEAP